MNLKGAKWDNSAKNLRTNQLAAGSDVTILRYTPDNHQTHSRRWTKKITDLRRRKPAPGTRRYHDLGSVQKSGRKSGPGCTPVCREIALLSHSGCWLPLDGDVPLISASSARVQHIRKCGRTGRSAGVKTTLMVPQDAV